MSDEFHNMAAEGKQDFKQIEFSLLRAIAATMMLNMVTPTLPRSFAAF